MKVEMKGMDRELKMIRSISYPNQTIYTQYTEEGNVLPYRYSLLLGAGERDV